MHYFSLNYCQTMKAAHYSHSIPVMIRTKSLPIITFKNLLQKISHFQNYLKIKVGIKIIIIMVILIVMNSQKEKTIKVVM